jgi:hypothetical protein
MENRMKTMFAALASALLVSTAFAQTAAPAPSTAAPTTAQAGKTDLKAGGATKTTADKASAEGGVKKIPAAHAKAKAHKVSKKTHAVKAGAEKAKTDAGNEANAGAAKTDATVKTQ